MEREEAESEGGGSGLPVIQSESAGTTVGDKLLLSLPVSVLHSLCSLEDGQACHLHGNYDVSGHQEVAAEVSGVRRGNHIKIILNDVNDKATSFLKTTWNCTITSSSITRETNARGEITAPFSKQSYKLKTVTKQDSSLLDQYDSTSEVEAENCGEISRTSDLGQQYDFTGSKILNIQPEQPGRGYQPEQPDRGDPPEQPGNVTEDSQTDREIPTDNETETKPLPKMRRRPRSQKSWEGIVTDDSTKANDESTPEIQTDQRPPRKRGRPRKQQNRKKQKTSRTEGENTGDHSDQDESIEKSRPVRSARHSVRKAQDVGDVRIKQEPEAEAEGEIHQVSEPCEIASQDTTDGTGRTETPQRNTGMKLGVVDWDDDMLADKPLCRLCDRMIATGIRDHVENIHDISWNNYQTVIWGIEKYCNVRKNRKDTDTILPDVPLEDLSLSISKIKLFLWRWRRKAQERETKTGKTQETETETKTPVSDLPYIPCPNCEKIFTTKTKLDAHVALSHVLGNRKDSRSSKTKHSYGTLKKFTQKNLDICHKLELTENPEDNMCIICKKVLQKTHPSQRGSDLIRHIKATHHMETDKYHEILDASSEPCRQKLIEEVLEQCAIKKKTRKVAALGREIKEEFRCPGCDKEYISFNSLSHHVKVAHKSDKQTAIKIEEIGAAHYRRDMSSREELSSKCIYCGAIRIGRSILKHLTIVHSEEPDLTSALYEAEVTYNYLLKVRENKRKSLTEEQNKAAGKVYRCKFCSEEFQCRILRYRHENYKCPDNKERRSTVWCRCGKATDSREQLQLHATVCKAPSQYVCHMCGKVYKNRGALYAHRRIVHQGDSDRFPCDICGKAFNQKNHLMRHKAHHSDDRSHQCEYCGKQFKTRDAVRKHQITMHENKYPYHCEKCGHGVSKKIYLNVHKCGRVRRVQDMSTEEYLANHNQGHVTPADPGHDPQQSTGGGEDDIASTVAHILVQDIPELQLANQSVLPENPLMYTTRPPEGTAVTIDINSPLIPQVQATGNEIPVSGTQIQAIRDLQNGTQIHAIGDLQHGTQFQSLGDLQRGTQIHSLRDLHQGTQIPSLGDLQVLQSLGYHPGSSSLTMGQTGAPIPVSYIPVAAAAEVAEAETNPEIYPATYQYYTHYYTHVPTTTTADQVQAMVAVTDLPNEGMGNVAEHAGVITEANESEIRGLNPHNPQVIVVEKTEPV